MKTTIEFQSSNTTYPKTTLIIKGVSKTKKKWHNASGQCNISFKNFLVLKKPEKINVGLTKSVVTFTYGST